MPKDKDESDGAGEVADEAVGENVEEPPAAVPDAEEDPKRRAAAQRVRSKIKRISGKTRYLN